MKLAFCQYFTAATSPVWVLVINKYEGADVEHISESMVRGYPLHMGMCYDSFQGAIKYIATL